MAALPVVLLVAGVLAGCAGPTALPSSVPGSASTAASPAAATSSSPSSTSSAAAAAGTPLTCDDLAPKQQIVSALAGGKPAADRVLLPTSTAAGTITGELAVEGAGGLSCSWSAGPPASEATSAMLTAVILPDAADDWTAQLYGDGPTADRRTFAGVSAAASCGDPGCGASAAVGSSWVRIDLTTGSREGGDTVFAKETDDEVFAGMRPAVESVFRTVQRASAAQLRFPSHVTAGSTPADCRSYLTKVDLEGLLEDRTASISTDYQLTPELYSIAGAAAQRIGTSVCILEGHTSNDYELARVTVAPEQAWAVDELASDTAARGDSHVTELKGQVSGERAVTDCTASSTSCTLVFSLASTAIQIENTKHAVQIAEAIIAEAR